VRSLVVRVTAGEGSFESLPVVATEGGTVERGPVWSLRSLPDGTVVQFRAVSGDLPAFRRALQTDDRVVTAEVTGTEDGYVVAHYEPSAPTQSFLAWYEAIPVAVEYPIEFEEGAPVLTLAGTRSQIAQVMAALPDELAYEVQSTGERDPGRSRRFGSLTARQREVLAAAIECGYYTNPRQATHEDVAAELSLAAGTVGDHLRSIEARVFSQFDGATS
jgi:predicted DNA binding protein